jgi:hypothetical protein
MNDIPFPDSINNSSRSLAAKTAGTNVESPVPQGRGNRAPNDDRAGNQIIREDNPLLSPAQAFIGKRTDELAVIAAWRDELIARIYRAQMRFELIGLDHEEQDLITDEVQTFKQICFALCDWRAA